MTNTPITSFKGRYYFLSNFYPVEVAYEGIYYHSAEHAYQAAKTLDKDLRRKIAKLISAGHAKKQGRQLPLRADWEQVKLDVMWDVLWAKFGQHKYLKDYLLLTGSAKLVEGNTWGDTYWGVCNGVGENHLGRLLMELRAELGGANVEEDQ